MGKITRKDFIVKTGKCVGGFVCIPVAVSIFQSCSDPVSPTSMYMAECPCHGAQFDQDGNVLKGPAQTPLTQYTTTINNDFFTIEGSNETIQFDDHPDLNDIGGVSAVENIDINEDGILLYRKSEDEIIALSRTCTHNGCQVGSF